MKVGVDCALCLFQRGYFEVLEATEDPDLRFKALAQIFYMLAKNFNREAVPAVLGTMRERIIKRVTGNPDPFAEKKRICNIEAMKVLPLAEMMVSGEKTDEMRFRKACLCAIMGNVIEFDIPGHTFNLGDLGRLIFEAEQSLAVDDISEAFKAAEGSELIVYLADNAGEIALDIPLIRELKRIGGKVIVAVKNEAVSNDATLEDAIQVGVDRVADKVITTGSDAMGLMLSECSPDFLEIYERADFVVAKGMGNAETITEMKLKAPHLLLLRTKCLNVASYFGVERDKNIAKIIYPR
ncbi:MAG: ARMT1-like domain-containing protein [Candidatus Bathyarchaeota archaeon]|nr:ARMT1-like domain-containing protein [Candidatus Bathyarchaeota archaeon]